MATRFPSWLTGLIDVLPAQINVRGRKGKEDIIAHLFGNANFEVLEEPLSKGFSGNSGKQIQSLEESPRTTNKALGYTNLKLVVKTVVVGYLISFKIL